MVWEWWWLCEIPGRISFCSAPVPSTFQLNSLMILSLQNFLSAEQSWVTCCFLHHPFCSVGSREMSIGMRQRHPRAVSCGEGLRRIWQCPVGGVKLTPMTKSSFQTPLSSLLSDLRSGISGLWTSDLQLLSWAFPCLGSSHMDYSVGGDEIPCHSVCKAWKSCYSGQTDTHRSEISCRKS